MTDELPQLPSCRCSVLKTLANVAQWPLKKRLFGKVTGRGKRTMCYLVLWGDFRWEGEVKQKAAELRGICKHTGNGGSVLTELQGRGVSWVKHVFVGKRKYLRLTSPRLEDCWRTGSGPRWPRVSAFVWLHQQAALPKPALTMIPPALSRCHGSSSEHPWGLPQPTQDMGYVLWLQLCQPVPCRCTAPWQH